MDKKDRCRHIIDKLEELYPDPAIPLFHKNEFTLLIAVLLSAQCTDKKVNQITPALFDKASNPEDMLELGQDKIYSYINQIGLAKKKSAYIFQLSDVLIKKHNGLVPNNFKYLEGLPGVGHKTASVVMAQSFGIPTFPVDTHIHRLAQRWELSNGKSIKQTEIDLKRLFPKERWNKLHLQIIFFGREYCTARGCDGRDCLICKKLFPKRRKAIKWIKP